MSHVVGVDLQVSNLEDLKAAAAQCGLEFREGQRTWQWYGTWVGDYKAADAAYKNLGIAPEDYGKCEHALAVHGDSKAYEIGVVRSEDGTYRLLYDFWGQHGRALKDKVGEGAAVLKNEYGIAAATRVARAKGHVVRRENLDNGKVKLTVGVSR